MRQRQIISRNVAALAKCDLRAQVVIRDNAAADFQSLKPALGTGIGLRWRSPVGPLRLDWAYGHENRAGRLHFSVGITF